MLEGGSDMLEFVVGVNFRDNVCLPSNNTGLLVVFVTLIRLFFIAASVGGGH